MQIPDILPDISSMSNEELLERIRQIRLSRITRKQTSNKSADRPEAKSKVKAKIKIKADKAIDNLSSKELLNLITLLKKG